MLFKLSNALASFLKYIYNILMEKFYIFAILDLDNIFIYIEYSR